MRRHFSRLRFRTNLNRVLGGALLALMAGVPSAGAAVFAHPTTSSPIALSQDDKLVFVVNPRDDTVTVLCARNGNHVATIQVGDEPRAVAVHPGNKYIYVANAAGSSVSVI